MNENEFEEKCGELSKRIVDILSNSDKKVIICVLPGVTAAISKVFDIPRDVIVQMIDSALEDMNK